MKPILEFILDIPGMIADFAIEHWWFRLLVMIASSVFGCFLAIALLTVLGLAGCIPLPWWL